MEKICRWEARGVGNQTTRYALRTEPRGKGLEIGAYQSWDTPKAEKASESIAARIEQRAKAAGYTIGEDPWNDLIDY
jgi:hypothetical protein